MSAPELSAVDIQREVERIFVREHRAFITALYGHGSEASFTAVGRHWQVIPTSCEMQMRAAMPKPNENSADGLVYLIDWTEKPLQLDLSCRLAGGRVYQVSRDSRLAGLFGARQTEAGLMGSGLSTVLLSGEITGLKKVSGILLTRHDAMRHFLNAWAGFPISEPLTAANLALWCFDSADGATLIEKTGDSDAWSRLRSELRDFVEHEAGPAARLIWTAFENNDVRRFIQIAALVDAHGRLQDRVAEGLLQGRLVDLAPGFGVEVLRARSRLDLDELIKGITAKLDPAVVAVMLHEADHLIDNESFAATRATSPWLPSGHNAREQELARSLTALIAVPTRQTFSQVKKALTLLEHHALDSFRRTFDQRATRQMAVRLAAYLVSRAQQPPLGPGAIYQPAVDLAGAYVAEGGFVDWCRGRLRGPLPFDDALNEATHGVLLAADKLRRVDNKAFAAALLEWHQAGQPSNQLMPIEHVTRDVVAALVNGHPGRKALVVMMDGMSWAAAVQLLHRLEEEQWAPILWRPKGSNNRTHLPPVLASLPTLTNVSRAAFFAGRANNKDGNKHTHEDAKRWAANTALIKANDEAALPELVLRSQLMDGEALRDDVRKAVDSDHAVVGVVVNAIDEELKGSTQVMRDYSTTVIKPLVGLLNAAAGAERIVVLASDHGHVLGDAMKTHGQPMSGLHVSGKRWRALREDDPLYPFEMELPAKMWRPSGAARIAAIWDETICHSSPDYGEHGGLSLAEVVAPVLLLAPEWLSRLKEEEGSDLETRPFPVPRWWDLEVPLPRTAQTGTKKTTEDDDETKAQLRLPGMEPPREEKPAPVPQHEESPLIAALRKSKAFIANIEGKPDKDIENTLEYLGVLLRAGDALSDHEFARRCQMRPHRVMAVVARMGTVLNIDGYAMVEYDRAGRQVKVNKALLMAQYGLPT